MFFSGTPGNTAQCSTRLPTTTTLSAPTATTTTGLSTSTEHATATRSDASDCATTAVYATHRATATTVLRSTRIGRHA